MILFKLKLAFRALTRSGAFELLNILGLAVAIGACSLIFVFIRSTNATDQHFKDNEKIFRLVREVKGPMISFNSPTLAAPFYEFLPAATGIPKENMIRIYQDDELIIYNHYSFFESNVLYVDANFFQLLSFPLLSGDPDKALNGANSVVISSRIAEKYFGAENPLGKILKVEGKGLLEVTGVLATTTYNTHLNLDFLVSNKAMGYTSKILADKASNAFTFYIKLQDQRVQDVERQLSVLYQEHQATNIDQNAESFRLQPLSSIYFDEPMVMDIAKHGSKDLHKNLMAIVAILLAVVSANFINHSIAKLSREIKQTGVKKILGSSNWHLFLGWTLETYLKVFLATFLAGIGSYFVMPLLLKYYDILPFFQNQEVLIFGALVFTIVLTLVIVIIPGLFFITMHPHHALGDRFGKIKIGFIQKGMLFFQCFTSFVLIVFTLVIYNQYQYMLKKDLGLNDNLVLTFDSNNKHSWKNKDKIQNDISLLSGVNAVSMTYGGLPTKSTEAVAYQIDQIDYEWNTAYVNHNFIELLELKVLAGSAFEGKVIRNYEENLIINESAAKRLGWPQTSLIGKEITLTQYPVKKTILGIVEDFHYSSLKNQIQPLVLQPSDWGETFVVKLSTSDFPSTLANIEDIWGQYVQDYPFTYQFLDETFYNLHVEDIESGKIILFLTLLTIIITLVGTLSLGAIMQQTKLKEITIRKVLGASIPSLFHNLSKDLVSIFIFASIAGVPLIWWLANDWLADYSYGIQFSYLFVVKGFILLGLLVFVLIILQSWKTVNDNPIHNLKTDD